MSCDVLRVRRRPLIGLLAGLALLGGAVVLFPVLAASFGPLGLVLAVAVLVCGLMAPFLGVSRLWSTTCPRCGTTVFSTSRRVGHCRECGTRLLRREGAEPLTP